MGFVVWEREGGCLLAVFCSCGVGSEGAFAGFSYFSEIL